MWYKKRLIGLETLPTLAKSGQTQRNGGGAAPGGRQALEPSEPLSLQAALLQVAVLLGIPIALLLFAKVILRAYFPELGY
jgi:hypothetical protein